MLMRNLPEISLILLKLVTLSPNDSYSHQTDETIGRDELNDSFSPVVTFDNSNKTCLLKTNSVRFENHKKYQ